MQLVCFSQKIFHMNKIHLKEKNTLNTLDYFLIKYSYIVFSTGNIGGNENLFLLLQVPTKFWSL